MPGMMFHSGSADIVFLMTSMSIVGQGASPGCALRASLLLPWNPPDYMPYLNQRLPALLMRSPFIDCCADKVKKPY